MRKRSRPDSRSFNFGRSGFRHSTSSASRARPASRSNWKNTGCQKRLHNSVLDRLIEHMSFEDVVEAYGHRFCPQFAKESLKKALFLKNR
uniref:Uncharacterized protein n=1 Tax=Ditylenchus dipsaci TaxID=166011 RepID=A0A915DDC7_9BILA